MDTPKLPRPLVVSVIGIITIIGAALALIIGGTAIGYSSTATNIISTQLIEQNAMLPTDVTNPSTIESAVNLIGIFAIIIGVASLLVAYGLFKGAEWGRMAAIIFAAIGIVLSLIFAVYGSIPFALLIPVNGVIIYYLTRSNIVTYYRPHQETQHI